MGRRRHVVGVLPAFPVDPYRLQAGILRAGDVVVRVISDVAGVSRLRAQGLQEPLEGSDRRLSLADFAAYEDRSAETGLLRFTLLQGVPTVG